MRPTARAVMSSAADIGGLPSFAVQLRAARQRDRGRHFLGAVECYCAESDCAVRVVTIQLKEVDGPGHVVPPQCPLCRQTMKTHHVATAREAAHAARLEARRSVNLELWQRDHPAQLAVPLSACLNERLPGDAA